MTATTRNRPSWTAPYLARLGIADPGAPSLEALRTLHRAHVEQVAYENIDIQLGRPPGIDPAESIARIASGRGGYCYNLNGSFAELLQALGYDVTRHRGHVHGASGTVGPGEYGNHMALTVRVEGTVQVADVGLGNALHEPIPLRVGRHAQSPYRFELSRLAATGGWRFVHDPMLKSFHSMDFTLTPAVWTDFLGHHGHVSTSPESVFVRICQVYRRDAGGSDAILGDVLSRDEGRGRRTERVLTTAGEWFEAASDVFGLDLSGVGAADRRALWGRIREAVRDR